MKDQLFLSEEDKKNVKARAAYIASDPPQLLVLERMVEFIGLSAMASEADFGAASRLNLAEAIIEEVAKQMRVPITYFPAEYETLIDWANRLLAQIKELPGYPHDHPAAIKSEPEPKQPAPPRPAATAATSRPPIRPSTPPIAR